MGEATKLVLNKISSYNIFNNLFPGIIFCSILRQVSRFDMITKNWFENLFVYYFVGMILSRFGSVVIEPILQKWKIKNKETKEKEPFLKYASYSDYKAASNAEPFITILSETNNTYRTILSMLISIALCKLYEFFIYNKLNLCLPWSSAAGKWIIIGLVILMFLFAYRKQTGYIRKSVERYMSKKS